MAPVPHASSAPGVARARSRGGLFAGWGPRRLGTSLAAAVMAGLLVGSSAFAASRAGGPLYDARLALEELTLPSDATARFEAELAMAQSRLAEIVQGVAANDPASVEAAVRGYLATLDDLGAETGASADRAQVAIQHHLTVLEEVLARAPANARAGLQNAIAQGSRAADRLDAAGSNPGSAPGTTDGPPNGFGAGAGGSGGGPGVGGAGGGDKPAKSPGPNKSPAAGKSPAPASSTAPVETPGPATTSKPKPPKATPPADRVEGEDLPEDARVEP